MPLDKSRIQGFGSEEPASSSFWGGSEVRAEKRKCPAGHELVLWEAKPGWCDGCGSKIKTGQPVMDCRKCNYYLCKNCAPQNGAVEEEGSSFWGALGLSDAVSGPAANSALDEVALRFGDVIDAAGQDLSEMAADFKSFMASAVGLDDEEEEEGGTQQRQAAAVQATLQKISPRSRQECQRLIEDFCQKYPAARVRPNNAELDKLWAACSVLQATGLVAALYDQLSFANGDTSWQPRLRILYALDFFYRKGGLGREVAMGVFQQAKGIIQHLVDVQQCAEKAFEVTQLLTGKIKVEEDSGSTAKSQVESKEAKKAAPDLLDMSEPAPTTTPAPAAAPSTSSPADLDLLGGSVAAVPAPALPQDIDLLGQSAPPATASSQPKAVVPSADSFDPNAKPASNLDFLGSAPAFGNASALGGNQGVPGMGLGLQGLAGVGQGLGSSPMSGGSLGSSSMNLMGSAPMSMGSAPMNLMGSTPMPSMGAAPMGSMASASLGTAPMGGAPFAGLGGSASGGYAGVGAGAVSSTAGGSLAGRPNLSLGMSAPASNGSGYGAPYIPDQLTPSSSAAPKDPFAFVNDFTGLGK